MDVPIIGQGTWMIEGDNGSRTYESAIKSLKLGLGNDTYRYCRNVWNGLVEQLVGQAIKGRREEIFITSKLLPSNASYSGTLRACRRSLKRLKIDWLDLYLLHWPSLEYPIRETMRAMEKLVKEGLVKFIGVSNFDVEELKKAEGALRDQPIACNQVLYHLNSRGLERKLLPYCKSRRIAVVGYSPFGTM